MLPGPFNSCSVFPYTSDAHFHKYFIYNPTTKEFATIEVPKRKFGISLAFDPRKSPHYRVVCLLYQYCGCWLEIYSSETQTWKASAKTFTSEYEFWFSCGVYWNDGLHWVDKRFGLWYLKLDEESLHETQVPLMPDGVEFWERHSNHLVESFDCLLYVDTFFPHPEKFNVYEMKRDYSGWTVKYKVDLGEPGELQSLFLYQFLIHTLVLGQREEDSFLVFQMPGQVIRYNLVSKTFQKLCDLASGVLTCFDMKQFASIKTAPMEGFLFIESLFPVSNVTS